MIDSHCHIDFPAFDPDRGAVLTECANKGVVALVVPGVTCATWPRLMTVTTLHPNLYPAVGLHPQFLDQHSPDDVWQIEAWVKRLSAVAIGEIGLDFYDQNCDRESQITLFRDQLSVARKLDLPVILHVRKAHDQVLSLLRKHVTVGGIVHAFNGSHQQAERYMDLGFKLGFGGAMTYDRARHLRRLAGDLPLSALVLETDAPDMVPVGHVGERNSPVFLPQVAAEMAALRQESVEVIAAQTMSNACEVLNIEVLNIKLDQESG